MITSDSFVALSNPWDQTFIYTAYYETAFTDGNPHVILGIPNM